MLAELFLHYGYCPLQGVGVLLAHSVEMQTVYPVQLISLELVQSDAKAGKLVAGIIDGRTSL
ncbi:hypothetical protein D3C81_1905410 [compost metagenome]